MVRIAAAVLFLFVLIAVSYSTSSRERADFVYVNPSGIHTLDPARMSWLQDFRVALNLWEGLTTWDPVTLAPVGGSAEFPPHVSEDELIYRFRIRDDARWSNGDPVTAGDFIRGWRRAMEPGTAADYRFFFTDTIAGAAEYVAWRDEGVRSLASASQAARDALFDAHLAELDQRFSKVGLQAVDERTLEVRLRRRCPYFLDLLGFPVFLPIHESIETYREMYRGAPLTAQGLVAYRPQWTQPSLGVESPGLVTNGAYALSQWTFKRGARFAVNSHHREASQIACRTIDMLEYDNVSASLLAYDAGDVDFLTDLSVPYEHELFRRWKSGERPDFHPCHTAATYFFNFNCVSSEVAGQKNPFLDPRVRRAFTLATDRVSIVEHVRRRGDRAAHSFVPPGAISGYEPPLGLAHDDAMARALLAEAGFADGASLGPVELLYPPRQSTVCQSLARMWEDALGVRVILRAQESKTFAQEKANQRFMIAWGNWYPDYSDPTTYLDCFATGNGNNDTGYANSDYDRLLAQAADELNPARRFEILREAERMVIERECPVLPVLHPTELIAVSPRIQGLHPNSRMWFPFRHVSVQR